MAASRVWIIHSLALKSRRCVVIPDSDNERPSIQPGEGLIEQPRGDYDQRGPDAFLAERIGPALSDICAAVDANGNVVALHKGDPAIYEPPGLSFVLSDIAKPGDQYDGKIFLRRFVIADATGKATDIQTVDATTPPVPPAGGFVIASMDAKPGDQVVIIPPPDASADPVPA